MAEAEKKFKATIHLVSGGALKVYGGLTAEQVEMVYGLFGAGKAHIKFPTAADTMHYMDISRVDRLEVVGEFD